MQGQERRVGGAHHGALFSFAGGVVPGWPVTAGVVPPCPPYAAVFLLRACACLQFTQAKLGSMAGIPYCAQGGHEKLRVTHKTPYFFVNYADWSTRSDRRR